MATYGERYTGVNNGLGIYSVILSKSNFKKHFAVSKTTYTFALPFGKKEGNLVLFDDAL